ncbi:uncharacterized protein LOC141912827 [Tubulanus polymorphus]|uniref:uncharacterized protein LOC141912827 n=1 Tax=Tubulanus polymorphus TaxID=672921 RepID=UPI003DA4A69E
MGYNVTMIRVVSFILTAIVCVTSSSQFDGDFSEGQREHKRLSLKRQDLTALKKIVDDIDSDFATVQKKWDPSCSIGAGMPGYDCRLDQINGNQDIVDWLGNDDLSPGKRSASATIGTIPEQTFSPKSNSLQAIQDLTRKRVGLQFLKKLIEEQDRQLHVAQKRNCYVNLGGHCQAETAYAMANQIRYLNSADSPGRKRRSLSAFIAKRLSSALANEQS